MYASFLVMGLIYDLKLCLPKKKKNICHQKNQQVRLHAAARAISAKMTLAAHVSC